MCSLTNVYEIYLFTFKFLLKFRGYGATDPYMENVSVFPTQAFPELKRGLVPGRPLCTGHLIYSDGQAGGRTSYCLERGDAMLMIWFTYSIWFINFIYVVHFLD